jgi:Fur family transcriptional regulator, ferric uptake regulator
MQNLEQITGKIKQAGNRITPIRIALIRLFLLRTNPLTIGEISKELLKSNLKPNKTTLYRALEFLSNQRVIDIVDFNDRITRYEIISSHHHHVICNDCKKVTDVELENDLQSEEARIAKKLNFKLVSHSLEFFGVCADCSR